VAFRLTRQAMRAAMANDYAAQLAVEAQLQGEAGRTRDFVEGVMAFLDKREARFEGR
jgi:2-(1,2-epoxy-1,2-dihydrophenyl)acetyl-CoA isomerase